MKKVEIYGYTISLKGKVSDSIGAQYFDIGIAHSNYKSNVRTFYVVDDGSVKESDIIDWLRQDDVVAHLYYCADQYTTYKVRKKWTGEQCDRINSYRV